MAEEKSNNIENAIKSLELSLLDIVDDHCEEFSLTEDEVLVFLYEILCEKL